MKHIKKFIQLNPSARVSEHPFTHPKKTEKDLAILHDMVQEVGRLIYKPNNSANASCPSFDCVTQMEQGDCQHRIVISNPASLLSGDELIAVGFCGQKRPDANPALLDGIDLELIEELCYHPGIASYSSRKFENGDWVNLVLFSQPDAVEHWNTSAKHKYAVRTLASQYYASIRLHKGSLPQGLKPHSTLKLHRTKYFDFQESGVWKAIRLFN